MQRKTQINEIKSLVANDDLEKAIEQLQDLISDKETLNLLTILQSRLSFLNKQKRKGSIDDKSFNASKVQIINSVLEVLQSIEKEDESKPDVKLKERYSAFEFDVKTFEWKHAESLVQENYTENPIYKNVENRIEGAKSNSTEHYVLGLPKTGKTTLVKNLLVKYALEKGYNTYYIPFEKSRLNIRELLKSAPGINGNEQNSLFGLDDFESNGELHASISSQSKLCIIPTQKFEFGKHLYDLNYSFVQPFSKNEITKYLSEQIEEYDIKVSPSILNSIIKYSGGILEMADQLLNYFSIHGKLPNPLDSQEAEQFKVIRRICEYIDKFKDLDDLEIWALLLGVFSTGKNIELLLKNLRLHNSNSSTYLQKLGIDSLIGSHFIRESVLNIFGNKKIEHFVKNDLPFLSNKIANDKIAIWTPDYDLKLFDKESSLLDVLFKLLKNHSARVDWDKLLINDKSVSYDYKPKTGDKINFFLGNKNNPSNPSKEIVTKNEEAPLFGTTLRSKKYLLRNRKQKELVHLGDVASRTGNWGNAEKFYREAISQKTDSNWSQVRLANLLRYLGRFEESIDICKRIVRSTPNPFASLCLGVNYYWSGDVSLALHYFDQCLKWKSNYINAKIWKARSLLHFSESIYDVDELLSFVRELRTKPNIKRKKGKVFKKSFQEMKTYGLMLYYMNYGEAYKRYQKEIQDKTLQVLAKEEVLLKKDNIFKLNSNNLLKIKSDVPIILYTLYLSGHDFFKKDNETEFRKLKQIFDQLPGLKDDLLMWHQLIPWKTEYEDLDKNKILEFI